jgi:MFS family permease
MSQVRPPEPAELISAARLAGFRRAYFTMTATDALGSGLFKTVSIFFWVRYAHFSVAIAGLGFTLGGISAMLPAGRLGDRFGQRRTAIVINVVAAAAVAAFPLIHQIGIFFAAMCLATAAESSLEPLRRAYIGAQLPAEQRQPFNARNRAVYNGGFGFGAALAGVGLVLGDTRTLAYLVIGDAASFLLAGLAMSRLPRDRRTGQDDGAASRGRGGHVGTLGALAHLRACNGRRSWRSTARGISTPSGSASNEPTGPRLMPGSLTW